MLPKKPPQPSCSYLPFQPAPVGIHTSKLMCESLVGAETPATRQNCGRPVNAVVEPGGVKLPPGTGCRFTPPRIGRAHLRTPLTQGTPIPSFSLKKKKKS